jgi:hypothetical protein
MYLFLHELSARVSGGLAVRSLKFGANGVIAFFCNNSKLVIALSNEWALEEFMCYRLN